MESLLPLCPQSVGESNLFPCLCRVGILLLFEFDTLWSPLTVMLTFCPTHGNYTFFPPQWKGECQLVNVGIIFPEMWVPERRQQQNSTTYSTSRGRKIPVRWYLLQNNMIRWYTVCTGIDIHAMPKHLLSYRFVFVFRTMFCIIIAEREILWVFGCIYISFLS